MTDEDLVRAVQQALPREVAALVALRVRGAPPSGRRAERDRLLRAAAALLPGAAWTKARRLVELMALVRRSRFPEPPTLDTARGCVRAALDAYGRIERSLCVAQVYRILTAHIVMQEGGGGRLDTLKQEPCGSEENDMAYKVEMVDDARDKFLRGACASLIERSGHAAMMAEAKKTETGAQYLRDVELDPGEYRGARLQDLARTSLELAHVPLRGAVNGDEIVKRALAYRGEAGANTTSDLTTLLETVVNKLFMGRYAVTPVTWPRWCGVKSVKDFRASTFYRPGSFGALDSLSEAGEVLHKNIPDGEKATLTPATKGNIIGITRRAIVNDDLGVFTDLGVGLGEAAAYTIEADAFALLTANSGLGPTQADGQPLFHSANRSNVASVTGAMSVTTWDDAAAVMAAQKDPSATRFLDLEPAVWLGPTSLRGAAKILNASAIDPANVPGGQANPVQGMVKDVVGTPQLTGTRHYFLAAPALYPVFAVGFIDGNQAPRIETSRMFGYDGVQMRVILDYGTAILDYRGAVTCPGA